MNKQYILALATLSVFACGDDKTKPDAAIHHDAPNPDAPNAPPPPTPGAQIDRMGRPAINTAANHTFDTNAAATGSAKDAYNADSGQGTWPATYAAEFAKNLAIFDALDMGYACQNGVCAVTTGFQGCGNQALYDGRVDCAQGSGSNCAPNPMSYAALSTVLADDELMLDTSRSECKYYLAVEFGFVTGLGNDTCGGRAPSYDVVDTTYTVAAIGLGGFTPPPPAPAPNFQPAFGDGVSAHTDIDDATFPFLGAPHNP